MLILVEQHDGATASCCRLIIQLQMLALVQVTGGRIVTYVGRAAAIQSLIGIAKRKSFPLAQVTWIAFGESVLVQAELLW